MSGCWWILGDFEWILVDFGGFWMIFSGFIQCVRPKNTNKCFFCLQKLHFFDKKQCSSEATKLPAGENSCRQAVFVEFGEFFSGFWWILRGFWWFLSGFWLILVDFQLILVDLSRF